MKNIKDFAVHLLILAINNNKKESNNIYMKILHIFDRINLERHH